MNDTQFGIPLISVVVCTYNRAAMLRDALASLARIRTENQFQLEIVVVNNASTDDTLQAVAEVAADSPHEIRYVYEATKGIASARNRGLREAAGEWIAFFDDDQLADPAWLARLLEFANQKGLSCVGGAVHLKLPEGCERDLHPFVRMLLGESRWSEEPFAYDRKIGPGTGNLMIHRRVFEQVGRFDERFQVRAEDTDLWRRILRADYEGWYVPSAVVHHVTPPSRLEFAYLARLAGVMGEGLASRECEDRSISAFALRWLAKTLRACAMEYPMYFVASGLRRHEKALGLRSRLALSNAYTRQGWKELSVAWSRKLPSLKPKQVMASRP